jgi:hypothetical protein
LSSNILYIVMTRSATQFGRFINHHRKRGVTPTNLAKKSGYSRVHIYNVARGDSEPTREFMDTMTAVCSDLTGRVIDRADLFEFKPSRRRRT